jgi:hypothetical protein
MRRRLKEAYEDYLIGKTEATPMDQRIHPTWKFYLTQINTRSPKPSEMPTEFAPKNLSARLRRQLQNQKTKKPKA